MYRADDDNYYAEDTFVVQLKAESVASLRFDGHGLKWLVGQSQPVFIGLVSLSESTISLYPTIHVNHAVLALHAEWVRVKFGTSNLPAFLKGQKWMAWKGEEKNGATVWLGEPLLKWSLDEIVDKDWVNRTYATLKRFLILARREIGLLELGQCSILDWSTNDSDSIAAQTGIMKGGPDEIDSIARQSAPFLRALMVRAMSCNDNSSNALMASLVGMAASLREMGTEIDPDDLFGKVCSSIFLRDNNERQDAT